MGVQPMPDGYDIHRQVLINSGKRQFRNNPWPLVVVALAVLIPIVLVVRFVRRRRRA
jgi:hypothetical protein